MKQTEVNTICSYKWPPKLMGENSDKNWKHDIDIWHKFIQLSINKRRLTIHQSLSSKARAAPFEIYVTGLKKETSVDILLEKTKNKTLLFLSDKG